MFNRKRTCKNPECRILFDPINPHADFHDKSCQNRMYYLVGLAKKLGVSVELIYTYVVLRGLYDQRKITHSKKELEELGVKFNAFPPPVGYTPGDNPSVYRVGDLGLLCVKEDVFKIVKEVKKK